MVNVIVKKIAKFNVDHSTLKRHSMCNKRQFRERKYQVKPHIEIYIVHHLTHKNSLDIILCTTNHNNEFIMTYITLVKGAAHQFYFFLPFFVFSNLAYLSWKGSVDPLCKILKQSLEGMTARARPSTTAPRPTPGGWTGRH